MDGRIGRVQFLTGEAFGRKKESMDKEVPAKALGSAFEKLSVKDDNNKGKNKGNKPQKVHQKADDDFLIGIGPRLVEPEVKAEIAHHVIKAFRPGVTIEHFDREGKAILQEFKQQQKSQGYISMRTQREGLPAFTLRRSILDAVKSNRVVIISGWWNSFFRPGID
jgi:HrpA-like RNA helicase